MEHGSPGSSVHHKRVAAQKKRYYLLVFKSVFPFLFGTSIQCEKRLSLEEAGSPIIAAAEEIVVILGLT